MRWLVVHPAPAFSVADVFTGWVEALRELGQQVATYNLDDRLTFYEAALLETGERGPDGRIGIRKALDRDQAVTLATEALRSACYQTWPDVVLVVSGFFIRPALLDLLRARGHRVVLLHTEEPYEHARQLALSAHADLSVLNDPTNLDAYRAHGEAVYLPHAYRPAVHHPGPADPALVCDLAFVGTGYASRIAFLERFVIEWEWSSGPIAARPEARQGRPAPSPPLDLLLAGNWQQLDPASPLRGFLAHDDGDCLDNHQTARVYRSARMGLNLYRREAETLQAAHGYAVGPREVEMAACRLFFLRDPRPEGDELFPMLPRFDGPEQAGELVRWYLGRDRLRADLGAQAREAVAGRTFVANATALLRLLDRAPVTR